MISLLKLFYLISFFILFNIKITLKLSFCIFEAFIIVYQNSSPCIIFFDEFDALVPKRTSGSTSVTDRVVNQFLCYLGKFIYNKMELFH